MIFLDIKWTTGVDDFDNGDKSKCDSIDAHDDNETLTEEEEEEEEEGLTDIQQNNERPNLNDVPARKVVNLADQHKPGQVVNCKMADQGELKYLRIISRAGKATGANKYY